MVASDFYKLDLRKNRKLAGLNGALGEIDNNKQKKGAVFAPLLRVHRCRFSGYKIVFMIALEI